MKDKTRYITNESQVPAGWVRLSSLYDLTQPGGKTLAKALSEAHRSGEVKAVKLVRDEGDVKTGRVWVDPVSANSWIASYTGRSQKPTAPREQVDQAVVAVEIEALRMVMQTLIAEVSTLTSTVRDLQAAIELTRETTITV